MNSLLEQNHFFHGGSVFFHTLSWVMMHPGATWLSKKEYKSSGCALQPLLSPIEAVAQIGLRGAVVMTQPPLHLGGQPATIAQQGGK